jgi:hypothetical protein
MTPSIKSSPNIDVSFCYSFLPADHFTLNSTVKMWKGMLYVWILNKVQADQSEGNVAM